MASAAPDGYTIMVHSSSHTVSPSTFAKLPFDTEKDFVGVTPISSTPNVLVMSPSKNMKTLQELLAAARAKPGSMNFASAGQGSATHLNAEKFKLAAKIEATNIPFKGSAEAVTEVMSGRVDFWIGMMAPAKTPRDIVNRLHDEVVKALNTPEVKERFNTLGADAWTLKPEAFDAYIRDEIKSNAVLVKAAGLEVQK